MEIVLHTITNLQSAINWLKSTFLYVRLKKNPEYYGLSPEIKYKLANTTSDNENTKVDNYLSELCIKNLNDLMQVTLINKCDFEKNFKAQLRPTSIDNCYYDKK